MKLHYRKLGEGQPLFILHGLFGLSDNWQSIGKVLSERFTVYLIDLRNHGHSPHSNEWNYQVMSEDVYELMKDESLEKITLMGHSMGGKTAMTFAANHCSCLEKLIVVDISLRGYPPPSDVLQALAAVHLDTVSSRREVEEIISHYIHDNGTKQFILKNLYWDDDNRLAWRFNFDVISKSTSNIAGPIDLSSTCSVPAQFIYGQRSNYITEADRKALQQVFIASAFSEVENAGHWVHAENTKGFMDALNSFL